MSIKCSLSLICLLILLNSGQCQKIIEGYIQDEAGKPIPFATIGIEEKNIGTYSFEDGYFSLSIDSLLKDTITIRHVGYHPRRVIPTETVQIIFLKEEESILNEVIVTPTEIERIGVFRKKSASSISIDLPFNGAEVGTIIQLPIKTFVVERLMLNLATTNVDSFKMRAKIYTVHANRPAKLFYQTYAFNFGEEDGNVELHLDKKLEISGPIFLSFEWLVNKQTAQKISNLYQYKRSLIDSIKRHHTGSVNIYNYKKVEVVDSNGIITNQFKLNKNIANRLKSLASTTPKIRFKTAHKGGRTYYRSHSLGKWYLYQQSLIAGIKIY